MALHLYEVKYRNGIGHTRVELITGETQEGAQSKTDVFLATLTEEQRTNARIAYGGSTQRTEERRG